MSAAPLDVTVCLVTHDHEWTIADCLARVQPFVREIVVADLESSDRTAAIAREYGARVYAARWQGCHSAVRNLAIRRATSEWILSLEPDELLDEAAIQHLTSILASPPSAIGFSLRCQRAGNGSHHNEVRLFRNHTEIVYEGRAWERVSPSIRRLGGIIMESNIAVRGTASSNGQALEELHLIHLDLNERADDPDPWFRLGCAHRRHGNPFHAECYLNEFLGRVDEKHPDYVEAICLLVDCYRSIDDPIRVQQWEAKWGGARSG